MATTPPPPARVHTPPPPVHGPRYDDWEPYSPRRSSRVAARQQQQQDQQQSKRKPIVDRQPTTPSKARSNARLGTPEHHLRSGLFAHPPSSPPPSSFKKAHRTKASFSRPATVKKTAAECLQSPVDSDADSEKGTSLAPPASPRVSRTLGLPTPSKTPKKRKAVAPPGSTARTLFTGKFSNIEDVTPKSRRMTAAPSSALNANTAPIEIYTDFQDRRPEVDESADNPFWTKDAPAAPKPPKNDTEELARIRQAVDDDDGVAFVFRGRTVIRRFHRETRTTRTSRFLEPEDELDAAAADVQRAVRTGDELPPMPKIDLKPRKLDFRSETLGKRTTIFDVESDEASATDADEEALTDIDMPELGKGTSVAAAQPGGAAEDANDADTETDVDVPTPRAKRSPAPRSPVRPARAARANSFKQWGRYKADSGSQSSKALEEVDMADAPAEVPKRQLRSQTTAKTPVVAEEGRLKRKRRLSVGAGEGSPTKRAHAA
ncbi:hypothetical protein EJ06DRAFT_550250 [Trichodelitschia bisporula]|uniref:Uncharacterized protein n=1 Tax=Trichodelitschia bisporula TaxID=703511 RepID=A0A6G1HQZ7_9PEZI|nr:hypothetical protein EJ06DRAFT_550250 [Trichodelitschia bisporula]